MKARDGLVTFNRGRVSKYALARTDVSRVALSADRQCNWMPMTLGPMSLRPGLEYLGVCAGNGALLPFVYKNDDTALLELTASQMRVWNDGTTLVTRPAVTASITNGTFTSDVTGWTDADEAGAVSDWNGGGGAGVMRLVGTGATRAVRRQQVTVAGGETALVHALRIDIERGPVVLRIGSTAGADDIYRQAVLRTGQHSIAFVPGGSFWIEFSSALKYAVWVDSVDVESAGIMAMPTPWTTNTLCKTVRWYQSGDVVYCACAGVQPYRIERRPGDSWSVVKYEPSDGPFLTENTSTVRLTPSAISGFITIGASREIFEAGHVGGLFRMSSVGQTVAASITAEGTFSDPIRVTGVTDGRIFNIDLTGTWTATVTLQRSVGDIGSWVDVVTYTGNISTTYNDELDNQIVYYRVGVDVGDFTSGTVVAELVYDVGSITGTVRITDFSSATSVSAIVLTPLGGTAATDVWAEGSWSSLRGWPEAVAIHDGRLWWSGMGRNWASAPDAFDVHDPDIEGDGAPINRQAGAGNSNNANWMLALDRLIIGADGGEFSVRSTSFDEPVTPSNYNAKPVSTKGTTSVPAAMMDGRGYFVGRDGSSVYEINFDPQLFRHAVADMTVLCPEIGVPGVVRLSVQAEPDVRLHGVKSDGDAIAMVIDAAEDVLAWVDVETAGAIEDVVTLPGIGEDRIFYRVRRTINGATVRHLERWALRSECVGGTLNLQADAYITGTGPVVVPHLAAADVVIWADGAYRGTATADGSGAVADHSYTSWVCGLGYTAEYKSAKLAGQTNLGLGLNQHKRIDSIGLVLADTHSEGLEFGPDFGNMDPLPLVENGRILDAGEIHVEYDQEMIEFPGRWNTDSRLCLRATAPKPATVLAVMINVDRNDKA